MEERRKKTQTALYAVTLSSGWDVAFAVLPSVSTLLFVVLAERPEAGGIAQREISESFGAQQHPRAQAQHTPAQLSAAAAAGGGKPMALGDLGKTSDGIFCHKLPGGRKNSRLLSFRRYS